MAKKTFALDNFSGGDIGRDWPGQGQTNKFRGVNVWLYPNGAIGPRQPLIRYEPLVSPLPNASVILATCPGAVGSLPVAVLDDDRVYNLIDGQSSTFCGPGEFDLFGDYWHGGIQVAAPSAAVATELSKIIDTNVSPPTVSTFTITGAGAWAASRFGPHIVIVDFEGATFRWSAPNAGSTWPAANFATAPSGTYALVQQKNTLLLFSQDELAENGDIWAITGVLSVNAILRRVDRGLAGPPRFRSFGAKAGGGIRAVGADNVYWINGRYLGRFDGSEITTTPSPVPRSVSKIPGFETTQRTIFGVADIVPLTEMDEFLVIGSIGKYEYIGEADTAASAVSPSGNSRQFLFQHKQSNGAWTCHDPGIYYSFNNFVSQSNNRLSGFEAIRSTRWLRPNVFSFVRDQYTLWFVVSGSSIASGQELASAPKQYTMRLRPDMPDVIHNDGDTGEKTKAEFQSAEIWGEDGEELFVRSVTVDYSYQNHNQPVEEHSTFEINVEALNLFDQTSKHVSAPQKFVPTGQGVPVDYTYTPGLRRIESNVPDILPEPVLKGDILRGRQVFKFGDQGSGNGFRIHINNWKGIMIHRILVDAEASPART